MNLNEKFMREISKIKKPEIFLGVARVLGTGLVEDKKDENGKFIAKDFVEVFEDVMSRFDKAGRRRKKELLDLLEKANRGGVDDGNSTENPEESLSD